MNKNDIRQYQSYMAASKKEYEEFIARENMEALSLVARERIRRRMFLRSLLSGK